MQENADQLSALRHSLAHILAQAILEIRPHAKLAFGPATDTGCYYDFELDEPISEELFNDIQKRMRRIIAARQEFKASFRTPDEAVAHLESQQQPYKVEHCRDLIAGGESRIGFYVNGPFEDMCAGPHLGHTGEIPPDCFRVDAVAGAYWRGDEKNRQLTRIYCLAFRNRAELEDYVERRRIAKERDHRKLGRELDLFSIDHDAVGPGLILWHPKGALVRHLIETYVKARHLASGYDFVYTPHIGRSTLWQTSGHLEFYRDGMYAPIDIEGQEYYLKPMNCPFHCSIFRSLPRSFRELPKRYAEWGTVYRFERSGTLHGLTRVRGFTQDDAHLFCREDQMPGEIDKVLNFSLELLRDFGFTDFRIFLSTRPESRVGDEAKWDAAEQALKAALERSGVPYQINPGDGAFYGPKIDLQVEDAMGRPWQLSTIQFDFNLPERFGLSYTDTDGQPKRPFMIHRALLGSMERFFAVLIEHFGGAFPLWLAPVQTRIIPVSEEQAAYADEVAALLQSRGIRIERSASDESLNRRIRDGVTEKIPVLVVVGKREVADRTVTLRRYGSDKQETMPLEQFAGALCERCVPRGVF